MNQKPEANLTPTRNAETAEELVGILTAISVVSRRLAKKLTLLERSAGKDGEKDDKARSRMYVHAD
jgi:hypothetical protein